jgi:hypothetical protein
VSITIEAANEASSRENYIMAAVVMALAIGAGRRFRAPLKIDFSSRKINFPSQSNLEPWVYPYRLTIR